jgi:hypothetical protein
MEYHWTLTGDETMSRDNARNQWYVLSPEGSGQVIVHIDHAGRCDRMAEQATYQTHTTAGDAYASQIAAVAAGRVSEDVTAEEAAAVVEAWDAEADPEMVVVERITP